MAIKTQMRIQQITGSQGAGGVVDTLPAASLIPNGKGLEDILSHMASAIKRIHGGGSFTEGAQGQIKMIDNNASGFLFKSVDNKEYLEFVTTDNSESVDIPTDSIKFRLGAAADLQLFHDGTNSYVQNSTGVLRIDPKAGERGIELAGDGAVTLYHDNASKLATAAGGISVTGEVVATSHIDIPDAAFVKIGDADDLTIKHDGTDSSLINSTGLLKLQSDGIQLKSAAGDESYLAVADDGALTIYHDNAAKFATTAGGISVTGDVAADGVKLGDDQSINFGAVGDYSINYDESATDALIIQAGVDSADFKLVMAADRYDDGGDAWQTSIVGGGSGKLVMGNDIGSKGTFVEHFSITPNATAGNSVSAFAGDLTVNGDLIVNGDTTTVNTATLVVEDKNIAVAKGAANAAATRGAGLDILHGGSGGEAVEGYVRVGASDDTIFELRAPGNNFDLTLDINATKTITVGGALNIEGDSNINQDLTTDSTSVQFGKVAIDSSNDHIDVTGGALTATASGAFVVDAVGDIGLDSDTGRWKYKDGGVEIGRLSNFTGAGGTSFMIESKVSNMDLLLGAKRNVAVMMGVGGSFEISDNGTLPGGDAGKSYGFLTGSNAGLIISGSHRKDIAFAVDTGAVAASVEPLQIVASDASVRVRTNSKLILGDAGEYIAGDGSNLSLVSSQHMLMDAAGAITLDATTGGGPSIFFKDGGNAGTSLDWQPSNSGDWSMEVAAQNKDFLFKVDNGGSVQEVARFVGNGASFRMVSGKKIEFVDGNEYLSGDGTDLTMGSGRDIKLDSASGKIVADGNAGSGPQFQLKKNGSQSLDFLHENAGDWKIEGGTTDKDIIFVVNDDSSPTEVMRLVGADSALKIASGKKVMFADSGEYISGDSNDLTIGSGQDIKVDATRDIVLDAANAGIEFRVGGTAKTLEWKGSNNGDWTARVKAQDKDMMFNVNDGSVDTEMFRLVGATSRMKFPSNRQIIWNDDAEAIYGDGSGLFLKSNNVALKLPTSAGSDGQVLQVDGSGNLSFVNQSAGATGAKKFWLTLTGSRTAGEAIGTLNGVNWSNTAGATDLQMDLSSLAAADEVKLVDVYVNGMLMLSGSEAERSAGTADYYLKGHLANQADRTNVDPTFAFNLEPDDVVVVKVR